MKVNAATLTLFSKEDEILIKNLYKSKGYKLQLRSAVYYWQVGWKTALTGWWWSWESSEQSTC